MINDLLVDYVEAVTKRQSPEKGDDFDDAIVLGFLVERVIDAGGKFVSYEDWQTKEYKSMRAKVHKGNFKFEETNELLVVEEPNGTQSWPDVLLIFNGIGLPIESKSSKDNNILWNSSLPKIGGLYFYNNYKVQKTTCFFGQHVIDYSQIDSLQKNSSLIKEFTKNLSSNQGCFGIYPRLQYTDKTNYIANDHTQEAIDVCKTLTWDDAQQTSFK